MPSKTTPVCAKATRFLAFVLVISIILSEQQSSSGGARDYTTLDKQLQTEATMLKTSFGLMQPASGVIEFADQQIDGRGPDEIGKLGIAFVPERGLSFREMSIRENLEMGAYHPVMWKRRKAA